MIDLKDFAGFFIWLKMVIVRFEGNFFDVLNNVLSRAGNNVCRKVTRQKKSIVSSKAQLKNKPEIYFLQRHFLVISSLCTKLFNLILVEGS